jgi:hypothetical protein
MKDTPQNDKSEYVNTGFRDDDRREGFGDDGGTRVGRPDGAGSNSSPADPNGDQRAHRAPHDAQGAPAPGQAGTNTSPVAGGIEGSEVDAEQGSQQSRVQAASEGVNPAPAAGDERAVYDL